MGGELWLMVGTIVTALLTLAGVIYSTRARPEGSVTALASAVKNLGEENDRLNKRVNELEDLIEELRTELDRYRALPKG